MLEPIAEETKEEFSNDDDGMGGDIDDEPSERPSMSFTKGLLEDELTSDQESLVEPALREGHQS